MRITKNQLKHIIQEELAGVLREEDYGESHPYELNFDPVNISSDLYGSEVAQEDEAYLQTLLGTEGYYDPEALTSMESPGPTPEEIEAAERKEYLQALDRSSGIRMMAGDF